MHSNTIDQIIVALVFLAIRLILVCIITIIGTMTLQSLIPGCMAIIVFAAREIIAEIIFNVKIDGRSIANRIHNKPLLSIPIYYSFLLIEIISYLSIFIWIFA